MDLEIPGEKMKGVAEALEKTIQEIEKVLEEPEKKKNKKSKKTKKSKVSKEAKETKGSEESEDSEEEDEPEEESTEMSEGTRLYFIMLRWFKQYFELKLKDIKSDVESLSAISKEMLDYEGDDVLVRNMNIQKLSFESLYESYKEFIDKKLDKSKKAFHKASIKQESNEIKLMVAKTEAKFKKLRKKQIKLEKKVEDACTYYSSLLNNETRYWDHVATASQEYEAAYKRVAKEKIKFVKTILPKAVEDLEIKAKMKECSDKMDNKKMLEETLNKEQIIRPKFEKFNGFLIKEGHSNEAHPVVRQTEGQTEPGSEDSDTDESDDSDDDEDEEGVKEVETILSRQPDFTRMKRFVGIENTVLKLEDYHTESEESLRKKEEDLRKEIETPKELTPKKVVLPWKEKVHRRDIRPRQKMGPQREMPNTKYMETKEEIYPRDVLPNKGKAPRKEMDPTRDTLPLNEGGQHLKMESGSEVRVKRVRASLTAVETTRRGQRKREFHETKASSLDTANSIQVMAPDTSVRQKREVSSKKLDQQNDANLDKRPKKSTDLEPKQGAEQTKFQEKPMKKEGNKKNKASPEIQQALVALQPQVNVVSTRRNAKCIIGYEKQSSNQISLRVGQKLKQIVPANEEGFAYGEKKNRLGQKKKGYYPAFHVVLLD